MRLKRVFIQNYCSCQSLEVQLNAYSPFVGYNNSGKSNILRAISWLLKKSVLSEHAFWSAESPVIVEGSIDGVDLGLLPPNQQAQIARYLREGELRFRRRQEAPNVPAAQVRLEVFDPESGVWAANPTGLDTALGVLFPEPIYIEAMDDAVDDVAKFAAKNTIGLLLKYAMSEAARQTSQELTSLQTALTTVSGLLNGPQRIPELAVLEQNAGAAVGEFFPGLAVKLKIEPPPLDELVKSATVEFADGQRARPFTSFGHGAQRAVQMALVKLLATYVRSTARRATVVLLIDEPELYLHPQAIEVLRESLRVLSNQNFQVIFTTHSPLLIASEDVLVAAVVVKDEALGTQVRKRLANAAEVLAGSPHQAGVLFSLQHSTYLLFSEKVVLVEGKTERMVLPSAYAVTRGHSLGLDKVCVVEASGSGSLEAMAEILRAVGFSPKYAADLDYLFRELPRHNIIDANSPEFQKCLAWLIANTQLGYCLDHSGLPARKDPAGNSARVGPEQAYSLLAQEVGAEIQALIAPLRNRGIWIWPRGSIEAHLGIGKTDQERLAFIEAARETGSLAHSADAQCLEDFFRWLQ